MAGGWTSTGAAVAAMGVCMIALVVGGCGAADPNGATESLTFYVHCSLDSFTVVAGPGEGHSDLKLLAFGSTIIYDNDVTLGPERSSKLVGKRQGIAVKDNIASSYNYFLLFTVIFQAHDRYNGTIQVAGTEIGSEEREISIVGGTGDFRGARGYCTFFELPDFHDYPIVNMTYTLYKSSFSYKPASSLTSLSTEPLAEM